jgi:hypothetical protein
MEPLQNTIISPEKKFTVTIKDINNNKALLPNVLYTEMEQFVITIISNHTDITSPIPQLFKLQVLKNAYLNDTLFIRARIKKLNEIELHLSVVVKLQNKVEQSNIICKAIFKFPLNSTILKAS